MLKLSKGISVLQGSFGKIDSKLTVIFNEKR